MRKTRTAPFDLSIRGDEQEHHRIMLEKNLRNTDLDIHLSSTSDEEGGIGYRNRRRSRRSNPNDSSVEYPRHMSDPAAFPEFPSFARSRDLGDDDLHLHSGIHGWSYRTGDDDEGINPYGAESLSTAAHHASVVTIGAGLGGGRGARREASLSGAEYDPERPLSAMIAGVNSKHTMLDADSKYHHTVDPLVVDSTAELDRLLESGHAQPSTRSRSVRLISPLPSSSSASSDSEGGQSSNIPGSPRPRLTDHLNQTFSPKRPRSSQPGTPGSPLGRQRNLFDADLDMPTPRPTKLAHNVSSTPSQPQVRLQPATPSTIAGNHSRMARNRSNASVIHSTTPRPSSAPLERNPFQDSVREEPKPIIPPTRRTPGRVSSGKVYLPDVTGLTQAVESPAKPGLEYMRYRGDDRPRDSEARLLQTLGAVQAKLRDLEEENSISRRRVHELELELEEAKREVTRERTRLIEREELSFRPTQFVGQQGGSAAMDDERLHERYKEAVEEKKALEALVNSLRSHLTRLTTELASHKELLAELRKLRDADAKALKEKTNEINLLRREVERLAGEVEVLRGVVEEGLKERRASRDIQMETSQADTAMSHDSEGEDEEEGQDMTEEEEEADDDSDGEPFDEVGSVRAHSPVPNIGDKTQRTDFATLGSSQFGQSTGAPIVTNEEIQRIAADVEERRVNMSNISMADLSISRSRSPSPPARLTTVTEEEDTIQFHPRRAQPAPASPRNLPPTSVPIRPVAPTPNHATRQPPRATEEAPFPQIRGEKLERLFFSAPEHNAETCTVCYRRRHRQGGSRRPSWSAKVELPARSHPPAQDDGEDEGFAEGPEDHSPDTGRSAPQKGKQREHIDFADDVEHWRQAGTQKGLPPQTVLARVIRELEDDFSHYKSVYIELADQYKVMDAASDVARRNTLANHLREVVDILEQKGDQIAALYDLLSFKDKPLPA